MRFLTFSPIYQERVWGGRRFEDDLGRSDLPADGVIGESWEIVDREEAQSVDANGVSLRSKIEADPEGVMGAGWDPAGRFPILVKWLDCREKLSLQVHPPAAVAPELGGEPKTENWYIAAADPDATLMAGLRRGVTRAGFEAGLKANALEPLVHTFPVGKGESIFIPSGRLHAIGGGNLILEIQQNSDTTYRVYDWGRVGLDGKQRQLHIEESLRSTDFDDFEPETIKPTGGDQLLADSNVFRLRKLVRPAGSEIALGGGEAVILSVVAGSLREADGSVVGFGQNVLLPARESFSFRVERDCEILVTDRFTGI